jgi:hypothetical protein
MNKIALVVAVIAMVIAGYAALSSGKTSSFGATNCQSTTCLTGGLAVTTGNLSVDAGTFTASSNVTASSSILSAAVGCIQLHATSTATWIKETYVTTGATSTYNGTVYWSYGTCS